MSTIQIEIQDKNGNPIIFNNKDWTITLQIDIVNEISQSLDTLEDVYLNEKQEI